MDNRESQRAALRQAMNDRLDSDEVRTASFDLGVSYDDLSGDTKRVRIISLIERVERTGRGADLIAWLRANRSDYAWPDPYPVAPALRVAPNPLLIEAPIYLELVRVPAGEFLMGSDGTKDPGAPDDEKPQHRVHLPEFLIGKVPVTVAQFAAFVEATGHKTTAEEAGSGWVWETDAFSEVKGASWQHPAGPDSDIDSKADHPVTQISWRDALAFCRWLSETTGRGFRLPTEAEWEKAARGADGRLYPWGDEAPNARLCNFESRVGDTTLVGKYPAGASPYGALDMAGNVWEWTGSLWGAESEKPAFAYPYDARDGREDPDAPGTVLRVLRGGAFDDDAWYVRCACRYRLDPYDRYAGSGFRVVEALA